MGLETRGKNVVVTSGNGVIVTDIADSLIEGKSFEWLQKRYPVSYEEIWEVVDYYADKVPAKDKNFKLENVGSDTDIDIEVSKVSDTMYFGLINFGKVFLPQSDNTKLLFTKGLEMVITEVCEELLDNGDISEASNLHTVVYNELTNVIGQFDPSDVLASMTFDDNETGTLH